MVTDFNEKIKKWNTRLTKIYKIGPKMKNKNPNKSFAMSSFFRSDFLKRSDKRIFLGGLKYIPFLIFCFLKNTPMPWDFQKKIKVLYHDSKSLIFFLEKNLVIPDFFFSQWSTVWVLSKKRRNTPKNFERITFPIFDDEEFFSFYSGTLESGLIDTIFEKYFCSEYYVRKEWLYFNTDFMSLFLKKSKGKTFYLDIPLKITLMKFQIKGGLILNSNSFYFDSDNQMIPKNFNIKKSYDYSHDFYCQQIFRKIFPRTQKVRRKFVDFPFLYNNCSKNLTELLEFTSKKPFKTGMFLPIDYDRNENFFRLGIFYFLKNKQLLTKIKKLVPIYPFFFDVFFSQKRISSVVKLDNKKKFLLQKQRKMTPAFVIPILKRIMFKIPNSEDPEISLSYFFLLKNYIFQRRNNSKKINGKNLDLFKIFKKNRFFSFSETTWIEGGIKICMECHTMMTVLLGRKNLTFLNLDFNFNLKPIKTLSTKERKKSRFSNSFHLCREILRFTKMIVDCHVQKKLNFIDEFQLADGVHFILTHIGHLTGIYRYKYKVMKQIRLCKSIKRILYQKFYESEINFGPGFSFWAPVWRIWVFFLRGIIPILERWLTNLLNRHFNGRRYSKKSMGLTKQRVEAYFDIELKTAFLNEIEEKCLKDPKRIDQKHILAHANDAWKCWKANLNWSIPQIPQETLETVFKYIKIKADWWVKTTYLVREKIRRGLTIDKSLVRKNLGRLTRLWFKSEQKRQLNYLESGPFYSFDQVGLISKFLSKWLELTRFNRIPFPSFSEKTDIKLLLLGLENIRQNNLISGWKTQNKTDAQKTIEIALTDPIATLLKIKEKILTQKLFKDVGINFLDNFSYLVPVFSFDFEENIVDSFLDQYLWFSANKNLLFPTWIKPLDFEIAPFLVFKTASKLGNIFFSKKSRSQQVFFGIKAKIVNSIENIDVTSLGIFLEKILDPTLASYLAARNIQGLFYKDMLYTNSLGLIRGLLFCGFIIQFYFLIIDILLLGLKNSLFLLSNNHFFSCKVSEMEVCFYLRYFSNVMIIHKPRFRNIGGVQHHTFDQKELTMFTEKSKKQGSLNSEKIYCSILKLKRSIPLFMGKLKIEQLFQRNIFSDTFSQPIIFDLCGFQVLINSFSLDSKESNWNFCDKDQKKINFFGIPRITNLTIQKFENRICQILLSSNSTTFTKIANKWNSNLLGLISYFREACIETLKFLDLACQSEKKIQNKIKNSLNSKMPSRFPPVLFYSPKELGGLGMLSISNQIIPESDLKYFKKKLNGINKTSGDEVYRLYSIPSLNRFICDWKIEIKKSQKVWAEYLKRRIQKKLENKLISIENLKDLWNKGVPRINTLFQKDRNTLAFDHGWRVRLEFKKYQQVKNNPFWWTNPRHDGKLWDLKKYRTDVIKNNGGVENILEHTLFKGTYFPSWEGLFWEKNSGFEEFFYNKKLTNAQRSGLNQIPNRRFTLWWSPTINRGNVYIGFQVQLDLTGIFMHGKIPTLKISLIQIFRAHLWQKIHESVCISYCKVLDQNLDSLLIHTVQKEQIHPRKSYKMNSSCADIVLFSKKKWNMSTPSLMSFFHDSQYYRVSERIEKFWIDIQLRWGDFDSHDIERYSRGKFLDYTNDHVSIYPGKGGVLIALDIGYNISGGYGKWIKGLKNILNKATQKIMKTNPALYILRERIRKSLQLYIVESSEHSLCSDDYKNIFKNPNIWFIDESCFYRVSVHRTNEGNMVAKPINGCLIVFIPDKGTLILRVIHISFWKQQKRLTQLARWKAAEEILILISGLPKNEQPIEIITSRKAIIDPLGIYLVDFPNIIVKCTELRILFQNLLKIQKLGNLVSTAVVSKSFIFNLYDNWLESISSFTAFSRLILILKSIEINLETVKKIIGDFFKNFSFGTFWPPFTDKEWVKVEITLKDLILEDFSIKKNIGLKNLTQNEIRDIILGINFNLSNLASRIPASENNNILKTSVSVDGSRRNMLVSSRTKENQYDFPTVSKWKKKYLMDYRKYEYSMRIKTRLVSPKKTPVCYVFPRNLLKQFIRISDSENQIIGFVFGEKVCNTKFCREIGVILIPPQITNVKCFELVSKIPHHKIFDQFSFIGIIKSFEKDECFPSEEDIFTAKKILTQNLFLEEKRVGIFSLKIQKNEFELKGTCLENFNSRRKELKVFKVSLVLSSRFFGFCLIPKNSVISLFQYSLLFSEKKNYKVDISLPSSVYGFWERNFFSKKI